RPLPIIAACPKGGARAVRVGSQRPSPNQKRGSVTVMAEVTAQPLPRTFQLPGVQSLGLIVVGAAAIAVLAAAFMWSQTPDYRVLYSNVSDRDGGAVIAALQQMNIPYKFADGGGALLVPANQV